MFLWTCAATGAFMQLHSRTESLDSVVKVSDVGTISCGFFYLSSLNRVQTVARLLVPSTDLSVNSRWSRFRGGVGRLRRLVHIRQAFTAAQFSCHLNTKLLSDLSVNLTEPDREGVTMWGSAVWTDFILTLSRQTQPALKLWSADHVWFYLCRFGGLCLCDFCLHPQFSLWKFNKCIYRQFLWIIQTAPCCNFPLKE